MPSLYENKEVNQTLKTRYMWDIFTGLSYANLSLTLNFAGLPTLTIYIANDSLTSPWVKLPWPPMYHWKIVIFISTWVYRAEILTGTFDFPIIQSDITYVSSQSQTLQLFHKYTGNKGKSIVFFVSHHKAINTHCCKIRNKILECVKWCHGYSHIWRILKVLCCRV